MYFVVVSETTSTSTALHTQRLRRGLTLRDLAAQCADKGATVSYSQLARLEKGEYTPRPQLRAVLAELLDLDINDDFKRVAS